MQPGEPNDVAPYKGPIPKPGSSQVTTKPQSNVTVPLSPYGLGVHVGPANVEFPPVRSLIPLGITKSMPEINQAFQQVDDGHRQAFGHQASPGLMFDVIRGWSRGQVNNIEDLFQIPTSSRGLRAALIASANEPPPEQKQWKATDPGFGDALIQAQGHPLTPQQTEALKMAKGQEGVFQMRQHLMTAGVLPKLQITKADAAFSWLLNGAYTSASGLVIGLPLIAYHEYKGVEASVQQGSIDPFLHKNAQLGKAIGLGIYHDAKAIVTGDTAYLSKHPEAVFNTILMLDAGWSRISSGARVSSAAVQAVAAEKGSRLSAFLEKSIRPAPPVKQLYLPGQKGAAIAQALQFEDPLHRFADNLITDARQRRALEGKEPLAAEALRAVRINAPADFISRNFSFQAKFRREYLAQQRTSTALQMYLARQLDKLTSESIETADALKSVPEVTKGKLSIGELKALHVKMQGGDWREAMATMVQAHRDWRTAAENAGDTSSVESHTVQLAALKLAKVVLEKADNGEVTKQFAAAVPLFQRAADELTAMKVKYLGLDPELAEQRKGLEYEVYKGGVIQNRKRLAQLLKNTQGIYDRLAAKKGPVAPEMTARMKEIEQRLEELKKAGTHYGDAIERGMGPDGNVAFPTDPFAEQGAKMVPRPYHEVMAERDALRQEQDSLMDERVALRGKIKEAQQVEHPDLAAYGKRIAGLQRVIARTEQRLADMEHREGAQRVPLKTRRTRLTGGRPEGGRPPNPGGQYTPQLPPELKHSMTGKSVVAGDLNINIVNLLSREIGSTVRTINRIDDYSTKRLSSYDERPTGPIGEFFAPMRTVEEMPEKWRRLMNKGARREPNLTEEEASSLSDKEIDDFNSHVYGFKKDKATGEWTDEKGNVLGQKVKGILWYDTRAFESRMVTSDEGWQRLARLGYNTTGRMKIFLAPRYFLNTFSNKAMLTIAQGPWAPVSMLASYMAHRIYDEETAGRIDMLMGSSRARSYGPAGGLDPLSLGMTKLSNFWHITTDMHDRRAAFLFRAWQQGFHSAEDMRRLVTDDSLTAKASEIQRKAEKDVVELGNLTWAEQQYFRHLLFVYPWRSRQVLWAFRTAMEHPEIDLILEEIAANPTLNLKQNEPFWMQSALKHYEELGYVVTGFDSKGNPIAVDAGRINTFSGLFDILHPVSIQQDLGPAAQFITEAVTGRNAQGTAFKGSEPHRVLSAFIDSAWSALPLVQAYARGQKPAKNVAAPSLADKASEIKRIQSAKSIVALSPGWLQGFGLLFSGAATERTISRWKLLYNYYKSLTPEKRNQFEQKLILDVVNRQGELLHTPVPQKVKTAVSVSAETTFRVQQQANKMGAQGGLPDAMHDQILVQVLKDKGLVSDQMLADDKGYQKALQATKNFSAQPKDHSDFRTYLMVKYAGGKEMSQWDTDIKTLASYTKAGFSAKVDRLNQLGLHSGTVSASQDRLYDVGRRVVAYEAKTRDLQTQIAHEVDPVRKAQLKLDQATYYANEAETPLKLGGKTFPSLSRLSIADLSDKERHAHEIQVATHTWNSLSPLDKSLLGHTADPQVALDWAAISLQMTKEHAELHPGETLASRGLPPTSYFVQGLAAKSPGFAADVKFASQPLATRMQTYKPIQQSKYADYWKAFLSTIDTRAKQYAKVYVNTVGKPDWAAAEKDWAKAVPYMQQWIDKQPKGFQDEVQEYVDHSPKFLYNLVRP